MEQIRLNYNDVILYIAIINVILGFLFGSFPLISGLIMKNRKYAVYGFIGSVIGGGILGVLLSYPIAIVFTWLILRKSFAKEAIDAVAVNENPAEAGVGNSENR